MGALPALVVLAPAAPGRGLDQAVADEGPIDRGATGDRIDTSGGELIADRARSPAGVLVTHLDDLGFDFRRHLERAVSRVSSSCQ